jgi:hypothetical protein
MPQESNTWCHCSECDAKGGLDGHGQPKGRSMRTRFYKTHLLRVKRAEADHEAAERQVSVRMEEASAQIFTATLLDDGPDLDGLPSKLWTARADFQRERASHITPTVQTDISSTSSVDAVVRGVQRLMILADDPSPHLEDEITDGISRLALATPHAGQSVPDTHEVHRHPGMNKKDRNQYTANALAVLRSVQDELRNCSQGLSTSSSTSSTIREASATISQARRAIQKITRSTADIEALKNQLAEQINNIDGRLIVLDTVFPQVGPINYSAGEFLIVPNTDVKLTIYSRPPLYNVRSSL